MKSPKDYLTDRLKEFDKRFTLEGNSRGYFVTFLNEQRCYWNREMVNDIKAFLTETIQQSMEVGREMEKERILKNIIEAAEPYDNAKWHNLLSVETIKKIIDKTK